MLRRPGSSSPVYVPRVPRTLPDGPAQRQVNISQVPSRRRPSSRSIFRAGNRISRSRTTRKDRDALLSACSNFAKAQHICRRFLGSGWFIHPFRSFWRRFRFFANFADQGVFVPENASVFSSSHPVRHTGPRFHNSQDRCDVGSA